MSMTVCETCREEDASYENQAQPVNPWRPVSELPNLLTGKKVSALHTEKVKS